jgi:hypothetical protein
MQKKKKQKSISTLNEASEDEQLAQLRLSFSPQFAPVSTQFAPEQNMRPHLAQTVSRSFLIFFFFLKTSLLVVLCFSQTVKQSESHAKVGVFVRRRENANATLDGGVFSGGRNGGFEVDGRAFGGGHLALLVLVHQRHRHRTAAQRQRVRRNLHLKRTVFQRQEHLMTVLFLHSGSRVLHNTQISLQEKETDFFLEKKKKKNELFAST